MIGKQVCILAALLAAGIVLHAQTRQVSTFEMRYLTSDPAADGETDFHGETEWLDLEGRIDALKKYADFASVFWGNPDLDKPVLTDSDISSALHAIKPQPLTGVRTTIPLGEWRACGSSKDKAIRQEARWNDFLRQGAQISGGRLTFSDRAISIPLDSTSWRFRLNCSLADAPEKLDFTFLKEGKEVFNACLQGGETRIEIYADFGNKRFFVTSGSGTAEYPLSGADGTDCLEIRSEGSVSIDAISLYSFLRNEGNAHTPYRTVLVLNEDFNEVRDLDGWASAGYDDSSWDIVRLPSAHGGLAEAGEDYYLRRTVHPGSFSRAYLDIETITHSGEVLVNGRTVAVVSNPHPQFIDISRYLIANEENVIAVRVDPYLSARRMLHAPSDLNIGWLLGRTELILTDEVNIRDAFAFTASIDGTQALQGNKISVRNDTHVAFKGKVEVNYYPWFPVDGQKVASACREVDLRPMVDNEVDIPLTIDHAELWTPSDPRLYKVEVVLKDAQGRAVDDFVSTTGIRTVSQKDGDFLLNGKPEILEGAQIMGFRGPVETVAKTVKCPSDDIVMRELLMIKEMNGNMLRIHVHAEKDITEGTNDPRYAEYADQLGICLIWQTAAWLREGEVWNIDFEGYPKFMKQVRNHPSIVMWEASNHPNRFKEHDISDSRDYIRKIYPLLSGTDQSRLISPTSFWNHMHFGNYDGTVDYKGNPIDQEPMIMAPLMTRGSQDAYTGYGASWSNLRHMPNDWAASCLNAGDKAYFNFEHEESAAQPNWDLARMQPWFEIQSYEWDYEKGSIGRRLQPSEWRQSQAFQAFSAWESMKKQILIGYDGFSWCTLESGANMFTYQKPLVDPFGVPKLAWYANKQVFNRIWAASDNVDTVYGPSDVITPVIFNLGDACTADLCIELCNAKGRTIGKKWFRGVSVPEGRSVTRLDAFRFKSRSEGCHFIKYTLSCR